MVGSMKGGSDSGAGGGLNSAGNRASGAGPGASGNRSTSSSSSGSSSSGGGLNSAGNRASGAGPGASGNKSTTGGGFGGGGTKSSGGGGGQVGGGLNSAGNRASGAGPGASSNRSTTGGGFGGNSNANGGGNGGLNSAGNRASGAGPGASSNRSTTGSGYGGVGSTYGGQNSPAGMNNSTLSGGMASFNASQDKTRQGDLAQQARASETQSMGDMATWGKEVKSVVDAGAGWTTVELNNGQTETRKGDRASRNNNPGNIEASSFTKGLNGYVGTDGRFAVFSSKEDGINAIGSLLATSRYSSKTVEGAIDSYAPPSENNTAAYASTVASKIGVSKDTPMSSLTSAQRTAMAHAIMGVEGNTGYAVSKTTGTDRFASTYMGGKTASTAASAATATAQEAAKAQQNDPSGLPAGTYPGHVVGDGIAPALAAPTTQATDVPAPTPAPAPAPPRSLGQKVAAGAIDIGLGMLPGVGTAVSVVNGGLALTGNRTLGERAVDSFVNGEGGAGPDSGAKGLGGGNDRQIVAKDTSTVPANTDSFEDRYMKFVDPTPRPTPGQRWNYDTSGYA